MEVDSEQLFAILAMLYFIERKLGGGFPKKICSPLFGEDSHFDSYLSNGLVQPPTRKHFMGNGCWRRFHGVSVFLSGFFSTTLKSTRGSLGKVVRIFSSVRQGRGAILQFQMEKYEKIFM